MLSHGLLSTLNSGSPTIWSVERPLMFGQAKRFRRPVPGQLQSLGQLDPLATMALQALRHTDRDTGISLQAVSDLEPYWEAVRHVYKPFESGLPGPTGRVYHHEIPGGQYSNLRAQASARSIHCSRSRRCGWRSVSENTMLQATRDCTAADG